MAILVAVFAIIIAGFGTLFLGYVYEGYAGKRSWSMTMKSLGSQVRLLANATLSSLLGVLAGGGIALYATDHGYGGLAEGNLYGGLFFGGIAGLILYLIGHARLSALDAPGRLIGCLHVGGELLALCGAVIAVWSSLAATFASDLASFLHRILWIGFLLQIAGIALLLSVRGRISARPRRVVVAISLALMVATYLFFPLVREVPLDRIDEVKDGTIVRVSGEITYEHLPAKLRNDVFELVESSSLDSSRILVFHEGLNVQQFAGEVTVEGEYHKPLVSIEPGYVNATSVTKTE